MGMFTNKRFINRRFGSVAGAAASQYLISDDLEYVDATAATAGGWTSTSTPLWGYNTAPAPLQGLYSYAVNSSLDVSYKTFTAASEVWAFLTFVPDATMLGSSGDLFSLRDASGTVVAKVTQFSTTGSLRCYNGTTNSATGSLVMTAGTQYYCWIRYKAGTGANGITQVWISTTTTKPGTVDCEKTNGNATTDAQRINIGGTGLSALVIYDTIRVSLTSIGDNP